MSSLGFYGSTGSIPLLEVVLFYLNNQEVPMDTQARETLIRRYFTSWRERDSTVLADCFAVNAVYVESYGPCYKGLAQIQRWFADWLPHGEVLVWDIHRFLHQGSTAVIEWLFSCRYDGQTSTFSGVTIADFNEQGKIFLLKEFAAKSELITPYQND